jgi:hypothetical protein
MKIRFVVFGLVFAALTALQYFWLSAFLERLPADYVSETEYAAKSRGHTTPASPAEEFERVIRRRDQALSASSDCAIIQGDVHWVSASGDVMFEILNLYGVDRLTRKNLPGYGNEERFGQFLFPPHTLKQKYDGWDPLFAGPHVASYDHEETMEGVPVYVFNFVADGIDETSGYSALPDVPEKYRATTYGKGRIWVEPNSGIVVDYDETGVSYFIEPKTGERVGEITQWSDHYTPETRVAQLQLARAARRKIFALEIWIPFGLAVAGVGCLMTAAVWRRRGKAIPAGTGSAMISRREMAEAAR